MAYLGRPTLGSAGFHAGTRRWSTLEAFAGTAAPQAGKRSLPPSGRIGRVDPAPLHGARAQARAPRSLPAWGGGNLELDSPGTFRPPKTKWYWSYSQTLNFCRAVPLCAFRCRGVPLCSAAAGGNGLAQAGGGVFFRGVLRMYDICTTSLTIHTATAGACVAIGVREGREIRADRSGYGKGHGPVSPCPFVAS